MESYGCDGVCLAQFPLDFSTIESAAMQCGCPEPIEIKFNVNSLKKIKVSSILKELNIPEVITKKDETLSLMSTTAEVAPTNGYFSASNAMIVAAMVAGGYIYNKKAKQTMKEDDVFASLV